MKNKNLVDVALLTCGLVEEKVFSDCIDAIERELNSDCQFHIIFNGVDKERRSTFNEIASRIPSAKVKTSSERVGFSTAANRIIRQGTAPLVLFITDDVILHEGTLEKLIRRMDDSKIAMCGLKLTFPEDSQDKTRPAGRVQHIGHAFDIRGEVIHPLMGWSPENPKCNVTREVQSVTGGVFMVRRNAFMKVGGFYEKYGVGYYEDVDLCFAIRSIGGHIWVDTEATATHVANASFIKAGVPIPMETNKTLFRSRWHNHMQNDNWTFW